MIALYLFSCIPAAIWTFLYFHNRKIHIWEAVCSLFISLILAGATHYFSFKNQTGDTETWSGQIESVKLFSAWTERYQEKVYKTEEYYTGTGKNRTRHTRRVFSHYEWRTDHHPRRNIAYSNIGDYAVSDLKYKELIEEFGGEKSIQGDRETIKSKSHMISGDANDYISVNNKNPIIPVTTQKSFENRLKAGSIWDKKQPSDKLNIPGRPENSNPFRSDRLLGTAKNHFSIRKLDELNAVLGPDKKVDINIVGYNTGNSQFGQYTESKWLGGNKNTLTICYGMDKDFSVSPDSNPGNANNPNKTHKPSWVYVFGWSESDICKRNIESLLLTSGVGDAILPELEREVRKNYQKPDWHRFDYIQIEPGGWAWFWFIASLLVCQGLYAWWCLVNHHNK